MDVSCAAENLTQACGVWQEDCELLCESCSREEKRMVSEGMNMAFMRYC